MPLKQTVRYLLDKDQGKLSTWNTRINLLIVVFIILSIVQVILESFQVLKDRYTDLFWIAEVVIVIVFTIEYLLRLWIADLVHPDLGPVRSRLRFIFSTSGLIDLMAIVPFYLPFLLKIDLKFIRVLRVVRLLRVFKLNRYTNAFKIVGAVMKEKRSELLVTLFVTFILILISSALMYNVENDVQPNAFPDIISTFWWAIATLTTVGYGDVVPITPLGKLISGLLAVLGIGIVALPTGIISAGFIDKIKVTQAKSQRFCPHCGEKL